MPTHESQGQALQAWTSTPNRVSTESWLHLALSEIPVNPGESSLWIRTGIVQLSNPVDDNRHRNVQSLGSKDGEGAYYSCPRKQQITSHTTEAWVDDSNDYINDFLSEVPWNKLELCMNLRQQNQEWRNFSAHQAVASNCPSAWHTS
jgi:hypothetical protein